MQANPATQGKHWLGDAAPSMRLNVVALQAMGAFEDSGQYEYKGQTIC
jgi:hypothetical protein